MKIVVLGGPGAGKGTQLMRISKSLNMVHISTGDIFRDNISKNTELGVIANTYISKGNLVPDSITCDMVAERLSKNDCIYGYALDGFPRTLEQAKFLESYLVKRNETLDAVIDIEVNDNIIIDRLSGRRICTKCGASFHIKYSMPETENICDICGEQLTQRKDDEYETIKSRLEIYHEQTKTLEEFYNKTGKLMIINGNGSADEVEKRILTALGVNK